MAESLPDCLLAGSLMHLENKNSGDRPRLSQGNQELNGRDSLTEDTTFSNAVIYGVEGYRAVT